MEKLRAYEICGLIRLECEMGRPDADRIAHWAQRLKAAQAEEDRMIDSHQDSSHPDFPRRYS